MNIIYNCYGGSHSSVTSAAIHLGLLDQYRTPSPEELWKLPYYDTQVKKDHGTLHFMGTDEFNNKVYVVGRRNMGKPVKRVLTDLARIFGIPEDDFLLADPMPFVNYAMVVGGFTSRRLGIIPLGRPIVTWGTRLAFPRLRGLVESVKKDLKPAAPRDIKPLEARIVVYCDYTGDHQAAVAAGIHLNKDLQTLDSTPPLGKLIYRGETEEGVKVYTLGVSYENKLIPRVMREFLKLYKVPEAQLTIKDLTLLGKYSFGVSAVFRHVPGLRRLGEILAGKVAARKHKKIKAGVREVKKSLDETP